MCSCLRTLFAKKERLPNINHVPVPDLQPVKLNEAARPNDERLEAMFSSLVDELGLPEPQKQAMLTLSADKKWQIYCSRIQDIDTGRTLASPEEFLGKLKKVETVKDVDALRTALRTQTLSFVTRFLTLNGVDELLNVLRQLETWSSEQQEEIDYIHLAVVGCVNALLNVSEGRSHILGHPTAIACLARILTSQSVQVKVNVLEILATLCMVPGGHRKVLQAFFAFSRWASERTRFQTLIYELGRKWNNPYEEVRMKTAILSLVNAVIKYGAGEKHLEFRLHIRFEFLMLGIEPAIDALHQYNDETLGRHAEFFEALRIEDERNFAEKFETKHVDSRSATSLFDYLRKRMTVSPAYPCFVSILFHLMQISHASYGPSWLLIERVIEQIILQTKEGDPDDAPLELNVAAAIKTIVAEGEMKQLKKDIRKAEKERENVEAQLLGKEREIEVKEKEIEELANILESMKRDLENERRRREEAELKLANALKQNGGKAVSMQNGHDTTPSRVGSFKSPTPAPAPPPPPPPGLGSSLIPPPPAPPPPPGAPGAPLSLIERPYAGPKPTQPLKSFNWTKLPANQLDGTIWKRISEKFDILDLPDVEKNFSAYQHKIEENGGGDSLKGRSATVIRELSVVDGRRAQNCNILLSKLKLSNGELAHAIRNVDPSEKLAKDMCEQLLKFIPSTEEVQLLSEHAHEIEQMATTDRFLYEMSQVEHYEERLKGLYYKKKFNERVSDYRNQSESVIKASEQVDKSKNLKIILSVVLAMGNYMNRGQRGNAAGFKLSSLNKLADTKSSVDKRISLLHYLIESLQIRCPQVMEIQNELSSVKEASKVEVAELEKEIRLLRKGLREIKLETEFEKKRDSNDKFSIVMSNFETVANYKLNDLEKLLIEMKEKYAKVSKLFAESETTPQDFFTEFDLFLVSMSEAQASMEKIKKQKEEEEKRKRIMEMQAQRRSSRGTLPRPPQDLENKAGGEFDSMISALRSGVAFGEDVAKMKRGTRKKSYQIDRERSSSREKVNCR
ncbi:DgyrCDS5873 [Dimorphilus gyrociliatus]|uniref:DgyrCDS5873 n=1 Tax=Dimorphilus gyrociliatus TaxID=2664684 RepID=A0A7I8VLB2_9ANNE|nr:DgyrCDS5873 [Dimorphilus gyrociliatus]